MSMILINICKFLINVRKVMKYHLTKFNLSDICLIISIKNPTLELYLSVDYTEFLIIQGQFRQFLLYVIFISHLLT
jgi:hypothetical protein